MWSTLVWNWLVDDDPPAVVGLQPGVGQVEVFGLALPASRIHHGLGGDLLAAGQRGDRARGADVDGGHLLAEPERHREVAQVELQRLDDLRVAEVQHVVALLHDGHLGAQRGEHRGVLDADHARRRPPPSRSAATSGRGCRRSPAPGLRRTRRPVGRAGLVPVAITMYSPRTVVRSPRVWSSTSTVWSSRKRPCPVCRSTRLRISCERTTSCSLLMTWRGAGQQVGGGDLLLDAVAGAVQLALAHAGQVDDRLAQRLGRNGSGVHANAAEHPAALDDRDRLAELRRRDRGLLPARTRTDDDEVVLQHWNPWQKVYAGWGDLARRRASIAREQLPAVARLSRA